MAFLDLVENFMIIKDKDRDLYYQIRDEIDTYKKFIFENLGYKLIIKEDFIKLEKIPAVPEKWMGFAEFSKKQEYIFFMLLLIYLEDKQKEEQFILSNITEYIEENYSSEKLDWTIRTSRISLINVINTALDIGIVKKTDGDESTFIQDRYGDVLYENTGVSKFVVRIFNSYISKAQGYKELLNINSYDRETDDTDIRRNRVYRRLLLSPAIYKGQGSDSDYEYIKNYRNHIRDNFEKYLEWDLEVYKNMAVNTVNSNVSDIFPSKKGIAQVVLFTTRKIRSLLDDGIIKKRDDECINLKVENLKEIILGVRSEFGHGFSKELRDSSDDKFIFEVLEYLKLWLMAEDNGEEIIILPLIAKFLGEYPDDYVGGVKDDRE